MPSTKPVSGTRDFLATTVAQRRYVIEIVESVYQRYGFEPLETPAMERLETLLGKYGEDEKLIFRLLHRGEKLTKIMAQGQPTEADLADLALRYDLTVPLARVMAQYRGQLPRFYKRYQIQPVWRADRPAKGRFREFWQCDVDIAGSTSMVVEAEVLASVSEVLQQLGFTDFQILLNHRQVLFGLMAVVGMPEAMTYPVTVAIDKLDKIGETGVEAELRKRGLAEGVITRLLPALKMSEGDNTTRLEKLTHFLTDNERGQQGVVDLQEIVRYTQNTPAAPHLQIDPYLARGLSYYTGAIYEIKVPEVPFSLAAGGRYDELVGMFSKQAIPACGFSIGLERILGLMEERGMFPDSISGPQVMVSVWDEGVLPQTLQLAAELRRAGLRVDMYPQPDRYGRQFKYAEERGIRWVLLLGEQELTQNQVAIKDLQTGKQTPVAREQVIDYLAEQNL